MNIYPKISNITWTDLTAKEMPHPEKMPNPKAGSAEKIQENILYLDEKIKAATRSLDYWDIYHFTLSVTDADQFASTLAKLATNSALVINCDSFTYNSEDYKRGDVVLKTDNGATIHVKSKSNGLFYPYNYNEDGTLTYNYANSFEEVKKSTGGSITWSEEGTAEIKIQSSSSTGVYNIVWTKPTESGWGTQTIDAKFIDETTTTPIVPVIKYFASDNEEVYCSPTISYNSNASQYQISDIPAFVYKVVIK